MHEIIINSAFIDLFSALKIDWEWEWERKMAYEIENIGTWTDAIKYAADAAEYHFFNFYEEKSQEWRNFTLCDRWLSRK
jgi:hypothetical protein